MVEFPKLRRGDLNDEQAALWDEIVEGPRKVSMGVPTAELGGPFNAWVQIPSFGRIGSKMGERLRFGSLLDGRSRELAILTVGAHWRAEYEFWAHARMARAGQSGWTSPNSDHRGAAHRSTGALRERYTAAGA